MPRPGKSESSLAPPLSVHPQNHSALEPAPVPGHHIVNSYERSNHSQARACRRLLIAPRHGIFRLRRYQAILDQFLSGDLADRRLPIRLQLARRRSCPRTDGRHGTALRTTPPADRVGFAFSRRLLITPAPDAPVGLRGLRPPIPRNPGSSSKTHRRSPGPHNRAA